MSVDVLDLTCPKCGGTMEPDRAHGSLTCPFCGYEQLLMPSEADSIEEKAYARQKGILQANAEADKAKKRSRIKVRLIIFGVIAAFIAALVLIGVVYNAVAPKVDPFEYITVEFSGKTGEGSASVVYKEVPDSEVDPRAITYTVSPRNYLSEGDTVTVIASSIEYTLSSKSKTYTVEGLDKYLTDLTSLSENALTMIHNKSDILVDSVKGYASTSTKAKSVEPCIMYLATDGNTNMLYDVYKLVFAEKDGSDCERFAVIYYKNVIVHDTDEPTMSYESTMYTGQIIQVLDNSYAGYMTGYKSLKDVKADILSHQSSAVTLQELDQTK